MQKLKGLWIPAEILLNEDLSDKEKIILSMILYLSEESKSCFASKQIFRQWGVGKCNFPAIRSNLFD